MPDGLADDEVLEGGWAVVVVVLGFTEVLEVLGFVVTDDAAVVLGVVGLAVLEVIVVLVAPP